MLTTRRRGRYNGGFHRSRDTYIIENDVTDLLGKMRIKCLHFAWDNPAENLEPFFARFSERYARKDRRTKVVYTGSEPATLTACVFGVCGLENGVMGWIKTNKDKAAEAANKSGSGQQAAPVEPPTEREEPPDVGL